MREVCSKESCCGCEACSNRCPKKCIAIEPDKEGFFFPIIDSSKCVDCGLCRQVCPALNPGKNLKSEPVVYAAYALDDKIRTTSSSGGIFSVLAEAVTSNCGIFNGVAFDGEMICRHVLAEKTEDISNFRGSKYVQSRTGEIYSDIEFALKGEREVLFCGTPCQVAGLYAFLGCDYEKLITCDIICHGVPSPRFLQQYLSDLATRNGMGKIDNITFRKLDGWGRETRLFCGNEQREMQGEQNYYVNIFFAGKNFRLSCYQCPYAQKQRVGDITIGDFWGVGIYKRFKHSKKKGVSCVLVNSSKGQAIFQRISEKIYWEKRQFKEAARFNHQLCLPVPHYPERDNFYSDYDSMDRKDFLLKHGGVSPRRSITSFLKAFLVRALHLGIRSLNFTKWS